MNQQRSPYFYQRSDRIALFDHVSAHLGAVTANWNLHSVPKEDLRVFRFDPAPDRRVLCTFGLSDHCLHPATGDSGERVEYLVSVDAACAPEKIAALLLAVAVQALRDSYSPGLHGILAGEGPVLHEGNPLFEDFYLAPPRGFPAALAVCDGVAPPTRLVQLIPVSSAEKRLIETRGWRVFEDLLQAPHIEIGRFDRRLDTVLPV